jgi:penicillin amidase
MVRVGGSMRAWLSAFRLAVPLCRLAARGAAGRRRALFEPSGRLAGGRRPDRDVRIARDGWGIPHVEARTWSDAAFAVGFCHGADRLGQLELFRRLAWGRLAAAIGRPALPLDAALRTLGYKRQAVAYMARIDATTLAELEAYARGLNEAIERRLAAGALPAECRALGITPEPWAVSDSLAVSRLGASDVTAPAKALLGRVAAALRPELRRFFGPLAAPGAAADGACGGGARQPAWGSNAWALAGWRTRDGRPMVCADPHVGLIAPCLWYAASLRVAEAAEAVAGLTVPGWPFVVLGRNRRLAWGATNMLADACDLYREQLVGEGYRVDGRVRALARRTERIAVRGERDARLVVRATHRGPLVSDSPLLRRLLGLDDGQAVSLGTCADRAAADELTAFRRINRAANLEAFGEALRTYGQCGLHFVVADADGRIARLPAAALPRRPRPPAPRLLDGATRRDDWLGVDAPARLPACIDPPEGFCANANELPAPPAQARRLGHLTCPPYRGRRLRALLAAGEDVSVLDAAAVQRDDFCLFTDEVVRRAAGILRAAGGARGRRAAALLERFDGWMTPESGSAAVAAVFGEFLRRRLFARLLGARLGVSFAETYQSFPVALRVLTAAETEGDAMFAHRMGRLVRSAVGDALRYLRRTQGRNPRRWTWGRAAAVGPAGPLGRVPLLGRAWRARPLPAGGSAHTIAQSRFAFRPRARRQAVYLGATARLIMSLGRRDVLVAVAGGQSENPASRHWGDLGERMRSGGYASVRLDGVPAGGIEAVVTLAGRRRRAIARPEAPAPSPPVVRPGLG